MRTKHDIGRNFSLLQKNCIEISWFFFIALGFCLGASAPAGFITTLSSLAFISSIIYFFDFKELKNQLTLTTAQKLSIIIFIYILLSISWSSADLSVSLEHVSEYRVFFMALPCFLAYKAMGKNGVIVIYSFFIGCLVSLVFSYLIYVDMWEVLENSEARSLANRIYHGFIMILMLGITWAALLRSDLRQSDYVIKFGGVALILLIIYNLFNIEIGRTAQVSFFCVCVLISWMIGRKYIYLIAICTPLAIFVFYSIFPVFALRVDETSNEVAKYILENDVNNSPGVRLELYRWGLAHIFESPFFGYGVGDVEFEMRKAFVQNNLMINSDNVHNEYINFALIGGIPLVGLLIYFLYNCFYNAFNLFAKSKQFLIYAIFFLCFIVHSVFNSAIKDLGEKTVLFLFLVCFWLFESKYREGRVEDEK